MEEQIKIEMLRGKQGRRKDKTKKGTVFGYVLLRPHVLCSSSVSTLKRSTRKY